MAVNERRAKLPGCRGDMGCTWEEFLALLGQYENCDFDAICENDPPVVPEDEVSHSKGDACSSVSVALFLSLSVSLNLSLYPCLCLSVYLPIYLCLSLCLKETMCRFLICL